MKANISIGIFCKHNYFTETLDVERVFVMLKIGSFNDLVVERMVDFGLYLNPKPDEVLLPLKYVPENTRPGDTLRVFVYTDSEDRPVATTLEPEAVVGEFAYLQVKDVASFGAFLDWGLEKDLLVPSSQQQDRMKVGKRYIVKVCLDELTGRVYGTNRITQNCEKESQGSVRRGKSKSSDLRHHKNRYHGCCQQSVFGLALQERSLHICLSRRENNRIHQQNP